MSSPQASVTKERAAVRARRSSTTVAAFVFGLPLAAGILGTLLYCPAIDEGVRRYVSHTVECVEVVMFCCALGALGAKLARHGTERRACRTEVLPPWDGKPVPVTEAATLLAGLGRLPQRLQDTYLVNRTSAVLEFLCSRGSANELDDHLRTLTDNDSLALEGSYSLIRFITWAIPILGFLGTVLGITGAISGVTPEVLEQSISTVTNGLALAFDATALALALTMTTMFLTFLVDRLEQGVLESVDRYADRQLAHRFERSGTEAGPLVEVVRKNAEVVLQGTEALVRKQVDLWADALAQADRRRTAAEARQQELLTAALEAALERTLQSHAQRLAILDSQAIERSSSLLEQLAALAEAVHGTAHDQQAALAQVAQSIVAQVEMLTGLQHDERHLLRLQETLSQNLTVLAGAGSLEQAVHSLTAAIHLLTAKQTVLPNGNASRLGPRSGAAA